MKIVVAGTGFSSILCINYLVNLGLKPVVLDVGNEIGEEEKIVLIVESSYGICSALTFSIFPKLWSQLSILISDGITSLNFFKLESINFLSLSLCLSFF